MRNIPVGLDIFLTCGYYCVILIVIIDFISESVNVTKISLLPSNIKVLRQLIPGYVWKLSLTAFLWIIKHALKQENKHLQEELELFKKIRAFPQKHNRSEIKNEERPNLLNQVFKTTGRNINNVPYYWHIIYAILNR